MSRKKMATLAPLLALATLAASPLPAETRDAGGIARCVAAEAARVDFSGVVSVVLPGGPITYARGRLAGPGSRNIDADTRFNLASAGKMFTAVAVAQLVDSGKIGLDDPVGRHVTGLSPATAAVTVRQLLTHSAGLGNYFTPDNLAAIQRARSASDLLPFVASDMPAFPPGSRFEYSNTGFLLLGILIERVSGETYGQYLRRHIFGPAGMTASGVDAEPAATRAIGMTAMPAFASEPPARPLRPAPEAALRGGPAGGTYSTAADLKRFFAALEAGELTSPAMFQALTSRQIEAAPATGTAPERDYGLGFGAGVFDGHRWFGHNGGAPGVNTELAAWPEDHAALIVLADRDPPAATTLFRQVRAMIFSPSPCKAP